MAVGSQFFTEAVILAAEVGEAAAAIAAEAEALVASVVAAVHSVVAARAVVGNSHFSFLMTEERTFAGIESLEDALLLLQGGQHFVVCAPTHDLASQLLERSAARVQKGKSVLVTGCSHVNESIAQLTRSRIDFSAATSVQKASQQCRSSLARIPKHSTVFVDLTEQLPPPFSDDAKQRELLKSLARVFHEKEFVVVWFVRRDCLSSEIVASWKDTVDFFFDVSRVGSLLIGQFLSAKGIYTSGFFFPRQLTLLANSVGLSAPMVPTSSAEEATLVQTDLLSKQYKQVFENAAEAILLFELWGEYREWNKRAKEALGYDDAELNLLRLNDLIVEGKRFAALRSLSVLKKKGKLAFRTEVRRKSGRTLHVEASASSLGKNTYVAICSDITDRVRLETEKAALNDEYRSFVSTLPYPYAIFVNRKLAAKNVAFDTLFPWVENIAPSLSDFFGRRNGEFLKEINALIEQPEATGIHNRELLITAPERKTVATEVSAAAVQFDGKSALYCSFVDVSERRRILDSAADTEEKFKILIEESIDAISISQESRFTLLNGKFVAMFGYNSALDLIGKEISVVIAGRNAKAELLEQDRKRTNEDASVEARYEYIGTTSDGAKITVEARASRIKIEGKPATLTYHRDVSAEKKAGDDFQRKLDALQILNNFSDEVQSIAAVDEMNQRAVNAAMRGTGFEIGALMTVSGSTLTLQYHRGMRDTVVNKIGSQQLDEGFARFFNKTHEPLITTITEYPPHLHYKSLFESERYTSIAFLPIVAHGKLGGIMLLATTKMRTLEESDRITLASLGRQLSIAVEKGYLADAARTAEEQFNSTIENISDVLYTLQPDGTFVFLSPNIEKLIGYKPTDFRTNANLWRTLLHPDDRPMISMRVSNQMHASNEFTLEYRILPKGKASYLWVKDVIRYRRDAKGAVVSVHGIVTDISAARALRELNVESKPEPEKTGSNVMQMLPEGIAVFDREMQCLEWNSALERITGVAGADAIGKQALDIPKLSEELQRVLQRVIESEREANEFVAFSLPYIDEQGELHLRVAPWQSGDGRTLGAFVIVTNVTGARRLQEELTESEELLRNVINAMGDALMITNMQGQIWEVNGEFTRLTGFDRSEVRMTNFPYPWLLEGEMTPFIRWIAEVSEGKHLRDLDMTWRHKAGGHFAVSLNTTLLKNAQDEPIAILNVARDISDRHRLTVELEWKNRQIELLNRIISYANTTDDLEKIFARIATEIHNLIPNESVSFSFIDERQQPSLEYAGVVNGSGESEKVDSVVVDETVARDAIALRKPRIKRGDTSTGDPVKSQITLPLFVTGNVVGTLSITSNRENAFDDDEVRFLQSVADQVGAIIQRVRLFEQVTEDSAYIHNLLNSINSVVYTVDAEFKITQVNNAWQEFMMRQGMEEWASEEKIIGKSLNVIVPDAQLWEHYRRVMNDLFARRTDHYSRDFALQDTKDRAAYHLDVSPMIINNKVTALVFTHTDITEINRTEAEIKRRNKELVALNAISTSISKSLELPEVLRVATEELRETFEADVVAFYLFDENKNRLLLSRYLGIPKHAAESIRVLDPTASLVGSVISRRKPYYILDNVSDDELLTEAGKRMNAELNLRSVGVVPLQSKERVPGAFLISFARPHAFTDNDRQLLLLISNQLGAAIENAQLYAEIQRQVETLTTLYELGKGLTGALDLNSMLQVVHREIVKAIPLDRFYYQSYVPENDTLTLLSRTVKGISEFYPAGMKVRSLKDWPNTIYKEVVANGASYMGMTDPSNRDSILAVPIKSDEKVLGIISLVSELPNVYSKTHLRLLESIANLTGVAIGKATLYDDTIKKAIEIENRNKELDDFTYVVSHDLKEPLISIEGYSKIVMKDYKDKLDADGKEYLGAVVQSTTRMKHLIDDLLTLSRLGRMNEAYETVSVTKIIDEILHDVQFTLRERNVAVNVAANLPGVRFSSTRLSMVFRNLIANGMKFNDKPNPIINIGFKEEENEYVFSVNDNGIGIEPQYFDRIFTIFQRLKRSEEYRGTGAGLTIAKKIIEREGGRIWVDSIPSEGSTFYFTVRKPS